jgi:hypothetical protein
VTEPKEPQRPLWFKALGFIVTLALIVLWWTWPETLAEHAVVAGLFALFLAVGGWANVRLGYVPKK